MCTVIDKKSPNVTIRSASHLFSVLWVLSLRVKIKDYHDEYIYITIYILYIYIVFSSFDIGIEHKQIRAIHSNVRTYSKSKFK